MMKITKAQELFCRRLFHLYRKRQGYSFDLTLKTWLYHDQVRRLRAKEYLAFVELFDMCSEVKALCDKCNQYRKENCRAIYNVICERSDYSPPKAKEANSYESASPVVHGPIKELLKMIDLDGR